MHHRGYKVFLYPSHFSNPLGWGTRTMGVETRMYALGTSMQVSYPWGVNVSAKALCPDGVVRKVKRIAETADTFFWIPASVRVQWKTVAGYVTFEEIAVGRNDDGSLQYERVVVFRAVLYRKNHTLFPTCGTLQCDLDGYVARCTRPNDNDHSHVHPLGAQESVAAGLAVPFGWSAEAPHA